MGNLVELRDSSSVKCYPLTKAEGVYTDSGYTLEDFGISPGVNLFNKNTVTDNTARQYTSGTIITNENYVMSDYIPVTPNTAYYLYAKSSTHVCYLNSSKSYLSGILVDTPKAFTTPANAAYIVISVNKLTSDLSTVQLSLGNTKLDYEPFRYNFGSNYDAVQDENMKIITAANLFNPSTVTVGKGMLYTSGNIVSNDDYVMSDYIPIIGGVKINIRNAVTSHVCYLNSYKEFISGDLTSESDYSISYTTPSNTKYLVISPNIVNNIQAVSVSVTRPSEDVGNIIHVAPSGADYSTLKDAIVQGRSTKNSVIYVDSGTYDVLEEFGGTTFADNFTESSVRGNYVGNGLKIVFAPDVRVLCNYNGSNTSFKTLFSPFNTTGGGCEIIGLNISCKNVRYCVHDELWNTSTYSENVWKDCVFYLDNTNNNIGFKCAYGCGLGMNTRLIMENCVFQSINSDYGMRFHNSVNANSLNYVRINNCYFYGTNTIRATYYGESTEKSLIVISNNKLGSAIEYGPEGDATIDNMNLIEFNNTISST